jgi:hypothetical protein
MGQNVMQRQYTKLEQRILRAECGSFSSCTPSREKELAKRKMNLIPGSCSFPSFVFSGVIAEPERVP